MAQPKGPMHHMIIALGLGPKPEAGMGAPPPGPGGPEGHAEPDADDKNDVPMERALYHGPDEKCGNCVYFHGPSSCEKWSFPVDQGGHCWPFYTPAAQGPPTESSGMPMMPMVEEGNR